MTEMTEVTTTKHDSSCCAPTCCGGSSARAAEAPLPSAETEERVKAVQERYGRIAEGVVTGCCGSSPSGCATPESSVSRGIGYDASDLATVPAEANLGLGCGAPLGFLALQPGETVLDLGSGPGLDVFLAARQVGPAGHVIGVDMTPAMLERARASAAKIGLSHVEFREGRLEALPVESGSVDAVTSNCVINLVPDKRAVFAEIARVLRPGGRVVISDILLHGRLPEAVEKDLLAYVGCVSGAMRQEEYFARVGAAGLEQVEVLRDVDYVAGLIESAPDEVHALEARTGIKRDEVVGRVRSVTFRAVKPAR